MGLALALVLVGGASVGAQPPPDDPHAGAYTRALGVACAHCHEDDDWAASPRPAFATAARMQRMVTGLSSGPLRDRGGITCYTCHRGAATPARLLRGAWEAISDAWPATATVSAANAAKPAREIYRNLQVMGDTNAGDIRLTMSVIAASLGVNCEYCHAGDEWDSDNKPAKRTAREMLRMFDGLPAYFAGAKPPAFQCYTCHHGTTEPAR